MAIPDSLPSPGLSSPSQAHSHSHFVSLHGQSRPSSVSLSSQAMPRSHTPTLSPNGDHSGMPYDQSGPSAGYTAGPPGTSQGGIYMPSSTQSPPPNPPLYIPPPQHALPPDPIHSLPPTAGYAQPVPWPSAPPGPNGWRLPQGPHPPSYRGNNGRGPGDFSGRFSGRPGSAFGESRDRSERRGRRDKERDDERELEEEVISTIFVVGFPDDMSEREFQNIFTFASGFEAATLKFPSGSSRREPAVALLAELQALAAHQNSQGGEFTDYPAANLEEAISSLSMTTASTSQSTTPSAPMSLTPSAPSAAHLPSSALPSNLPALPSSRRQTIGFARFKTRPDALAARDHLQGKKIDGLTGATLKAEMAKKNLHTKKSTAGEELVGFLLRNGRIGFGGTGGTGSASESISGGSVPAPPPGQVTLPPAGFQRQQSQTTPPVSGTGQGQSIAQGPWDSWNSTAPYAPNEQEPQGDQTLLSYPTHSQHQPQQSYSSSTTFIPSPSNQPTSLPSQQQTQFPSQSVTSPNATLSPPSSMASPHTQQRQDSKALLALAEEADELEGWSVNGAVGMGIGLEYQAVPPRWALGSSQAGQGQYGSGAIGAGHGSGAHAAGNRDYGDVVDGAAMGGVSGGGAGGSGGRGLGTNPADQNPPINTLYVGNLPAVSPPTHPPGFLEESLRSLFSRCSGFKRMSYRQKINGPMCFVEFEEVGYASMAIKELYGHNLGGLVKGGIRLSYSKNSLGQRGNNHPSQINTSLYGGLAHNVALAGMAMTSPTSASLALPSSGANGIAIGGGNGSTPAGGYGFSMQQMQARDAANGPMGEVRRESAPSSTLTGNGGYSQSQSLGANPAGTSLSPTAQPFNVSLPPTSPRSRYFASPPLSSGQHKLSPTESASSFSNSTSTNTASGSNPNSNTNSIGQTPNGVPIPPSNRSSSSSFQPFGQPSASPSSGFSPVSSPIRTPASFSWLSSSAGGSGHIGGGGPNSLSGGAGLGSSSLGGGSLGGPGLGGYAGFEFGGSVPLGSLNGAASAWGQSERRD